MVHGLGKTECHPGTNRLWAWFECISVFPLASHWDKAYTRVTLCIFDFPRTSGQPTTTSTTTLAAVAPPVLSWDSNSSYWGRNNPSRQGTRKYIFFPPSLNQPRQPSNNLPLPTLYFQRANLQRPCVSRWLLLEAADTLISAPRSSNGRLLVALHAPPALPRRVNLPRESSAPTPTRTAAPGRGNHGDARTRTHPGLLANLELPLCSTAPQLHLLTSRLPLSLLRGNRCLFIRLKESNPALSPTQPRATSVIHNSPKLRLNLTHSTSLRPPFLDIPPRRTCRTRIVRRPTWAFTSSRRCRILPMALMSIVTTRAMMPLVPCRSPTRLVHLFITTILTSSCQS